MTSYHGPKQLGTLPDDILRLIFAELLLDRRALLALQLTSRILHTASEPFLYQILQFHDDGYYYPRRSVYTRLELLASRIDRSGGILCLHVRQFSLVVTENNEQTATLVRINNVLEKCVNVKSISIEFEHRHEENEASPFPIFFSADAPFDLIDFAWTGWVPNGHGFAKFLDSQKSMRHLSLGVIHADILLPPTSLPTLQILQAPVLSVAVPFLINRPGITRLKLDMVKEAQVNSCPRDILSNILVFVTDDEEYRWTFTLASRMPRLQNLAIAARVVSITLRITLLFLALLLSATSWDIAILGSATNHPDTPPPLRRTHGRRLRPSSRRMLQDTPSASVCRPRKGRGRVPPLASRCAATHPSTHPWSIRVLAGQLAGVSSGQGGEGQET